MVVDEAELRSIQRKMNVTDRKELEQKAEGGRRLACEGGRRTRAYQKVKDAMVW